MNHKSMSDKRGHPTQLPKEHIDWIVQPLKRFVKIEAAAGVVLLLSTLLALSLANSPLSESFNDLWHVSLGINIGTFVFERSLHGWINDAVMTLFFFLIALELKRALVLGELRNTRLAMLSISAAVGGMLVPAAVYLFFQYVMRTLITPICSPRISTGNSAVSFSLSSSIVSSIEKIVLLTERYPRRDF